MEINMIKKSVGLLRKVIAKRAEIVRVINQVLHAENLMILEMSDSTFSVSGHTVGSDMTVFMLGRALGVSVKAAQEEYPDLQIDNYLSQPPRVAINYLQSIAQADAND